MRTDGGFRNQVILARRRLAHALATYLTRRWDVRHHVETGGRIALSDAPVNLSSDKLQSGYDVVSTPPSVFSFVTKHLPERLEDYSFIDVGAGKGRVVLLASELGFKASIGVEFAHFASAIAQDNLARYASRALHRSPCRIVNTDATKFEFPSGDLVLFFNNPFAAEVWPQMVAKVMQTTRDRNSIWIILIGSFPETIRGATEQFERSGLFTKRAEGVTAKFLDSYARFHYIILTNV